VEGSRVPKGPWSQQPIMGHVLALPLVLDRLLKPWVPQLSQPTAMTALLPSGYCEDP
jgi:hypothetical protein